MTSLMFSPAPSNQVSKMFQLFFFADDTGIKICLRIFLNSRMCFFSKLCLGVIWIKVASMIRMSGFGTLCRSHIAKCLC